MALFIPNAAVQMKSASAVLPEILSRLSPARALAAFDLAPKCRRAGPRLCGPSLSHVCGDVFFRHSYPPRTLSAAYEAGIAGVLTIIKAALVGSALMLLLLYWLLD